VQCSFSFFSVAQRYYETGGLSYCREAVGRCVDLRYGATKKTVE
jgi:hypothetical protein